MTWWEAAILGLLQGLTEFLPVSSSGHLVLGQHLLGLPSDDVSFEVFVHFGTVLSIVAVYRERIVEILRSVWCAVREPSRISLHYSGNAEFRFAVFILISMIPTGIIYLLFDDWLEQAFGNPRLVLGMLLVTGTLLILTKLRSRPEGPITLFKSVLIGIAQGSALIPGISRSGSTICTALYLNVTPEKAANFSFLMSLPVIVGATGIQVIRLFDVGMTTTIIPMLVGMIVAFASGVVAIKIVLDFVRRGNLQYFAYYCYAVGILGLLFI